MLPGFRLLLATTVLAISVLVFGLGAAALLRAAHEEFASLPSWRLAQQPVLTPFTPQVPRLETTPILAMLRIEAPSTKPLPETLRRDVVLPEATRRQPVAALPVATLPVASVYATSLPAPTDDPDAKPFETAAQDSGVAVKETESASAAEQTAPLNAQASIDAAVKPDAPVDVANVPAAKAPDVSALDSKILESKILESKSRDAVATETRAAEVKSAALKSPDAPPASRKASDTEASEPISTETVASIERSSEATAFAIEPHPVVKKAKRPSAREQARRRQIARARAEARAKAEQLRQQQSAFPLFGG